MYKVFLYHIRKDRFKTLYWEYDKYKDLLKTNIIIVDNNLSKSKKKLKTMTTLYSVRKNLSAKSNTIEKITESNILRY